MDTLLWMNKAISKTGELTPNTDFFLKDLFEGAEWNTLERGEKLGLGRIFKNAVQEGQVPNISYIGKAPNNSAKYRKN